MKRLISMAFGLSLFALSAGSAQANNYRLVADPSGALMCFGPADSKATLSNCSGQIVENISYRMAAGPIRIANVFF